jgi:hypothetical protein
MNICSYVLVMLFLCMMIDLSHAVDKKELKMIEYLEGSWRYRTIDINGNDVNEPRVVKYIRSTSKDALYGDVGQASIVYKWDARTDSLLMVELVCFLGKPTISVLVGNYDPEKKRIEWRVGDKSGARKHIWKLEGRNKIISEMDADWVRDRRKELEKSPIPRDAPTGPELIYIMERIDSGVSSD